MKAHKQQGAALVAALLILMVVSIIGVTALRSTAMSGRVATGAYLDAVVFEGAESVIAETLALVIQFNNSNDPAIFDQIVGIFNGEVITWCLLKGGVRKLSGCGNNDHFDSRGLLVLESRTMEVARSAAPGFQLSSSGGGTALFGDIIVAVQGDATMPGFGLTNRHVQHAKRRGMIPTDF
jgi:type IV pilus assembly protein PilX